MEAEGSIYGVDVARSQQCQKLSVQLTRHKWEEQGHFDDVSSPGIEKGHGWDLRHDSPEVESEGITTGPTQTRLKEVGVHHGGFGLVGEGAKYVLLSV